MHHQRQRNPPVRPHLRPRQPLPLSAPSWRLSPQSQSHPSPPQSQRMPWFRPLNRSSQPPSLLSPSLPQSLLRLPSVRRCVLLEAIALIFLALSPSFVVSSFVIELTIFFLLSPTISLPCHSDVPAGAGNGRVHRPVRNGTVPGDWWAPLSFCRSRSCIPVYGIPSLFLHAI